MSFCPLCLHTLVPIPVCKLGCWLLLAKAFDSNQCQGRATQLIDILPVTRRDSKAGGTAGREIAYRYRWEQERMLAEIHDLRNSEYFWLERWTSKGGARAGNMDKVLLTGQRLTTLVMMAEKCLQLSISVLISLINDPFLPSVWGVETSCSDNTWASWNLEVCTSRKASKTHRCIFIPEEY